MSSARSDASFDRTLRGELTSEEYVQGLRRKAALAQPAPGEEVMDFLRRCWPTAIADLEAERDQLCDIIANLYMARGSDVSTLRQMIRKAFGEARRSS